MEKIQNLINIIYNSHYAVDKTKIDYNSDKLKIYDLEMCYIETRTILDVITDLIKEAE